MRLRLVGIVGACALALTSWSCEEGLNAIDPTCNADLDSGEPIDVGNAQVDALLEATADFNLSSQELQMQVLAACQGIASDLDPSYQPVDDVTDDCNKATEEINRIKAAHAETTLTVQFVPAQCSVSAQATASCAVECDASFDVDATPITCEGGELSVMCEGTCEGTCTVDVEAACTGACTANCTGTCSAAVDAKCTGTCQGQCEGTCSSEDADGNCNGECTGICRGACSGTIEGSCSEVCDGTCSGGCTSTVDAECSGRCSGSCTGEATPLRCEGGVTRVEANAECKAACEAEASFEAECSEPNLVITFEGAVDTELEALADTLRANLGAIVAALQQLGHMARAAAGIADQLGKTVEAAATTSIQAFACATLAVDVSVEVAVEVEATSCAGLSVNEAAGLPGGSCGGS